MNYTNRAPISIAGAAAASVALVIPVSAFAQKKIVLGFSQIGAESEWRSANTNSIKETAAKEGIDLKFSDAQQKQENQPGQSLLDNLVFARQRNFRINASVKVSSSITLQSRIELNNRRVENVAVANGVVFFQDIQYNKLGSPFSVSIRYVNFDTDDYDTRIYAYENDIPGVFSIPSYYYQGRRFYALVKFHFSKGIDFWLRYGTTIYDHLNEVGSGYDVINKNHKSDLKLQLKLEF